MQFHGNNKQAGLFQLSEFIMIMNTNKTMIATVSGNDCFSILEKLIPFNLISG